MDRIELLEKILKHCDTRAQADEIYKIVAPELAALRLALDDAINSIKGPVSYSPQPIYTPKINVKQIERWEKALAIQPSLNASAETEDFKKAYLQEYQKVIAFDDLFKKFHAEIKERLESYRYWGENPKIESPAGNLKKEA